MSDEEHHFESKADAGASKTYPQQAGTIRKNGYIVIKGRPCKVVEVSTSKTGKHGHAKCHFVAIDIFTAKKLEDIVPSSHNCDVPHVNRRRNTDPKTFESTPSALFSPVLASSLHLPAWMILPRTVTSFSSMFHWVDSVLPRMWPIIVCSSQVMRQSSSLVLVWR